MRSRGKDQDVKERTIGRTDSPVPIRRDPSITTLILQGLFIHRDVPPMEG